MNLNTTQCQRRWILIFLGVLQGLTFFGGAHLIWDLSRTLESEALEVRNFATPRLRLADSSRVGLQGLLESSLNPGPEFQKEALEQTLRLRSLIEGEDYSNSLLPDLDTLESELKQSQASLPSIRHQIKALQARFALQARYPLRTLERSLMRQAELAHELKTLGVLWFIVQWIMGMAALYFFARMETGTDSQRFLDTALQNMQNVQQSRVDYFRTLALNPSEIKIIPNSDGLVLEAFRGGHEVDDWVGRRIEDVLQTAGQTQAPILANLIKDPRSQWCLARLLKEPEWVWCARYDGWENGYLCITLTRQIPAEKLQESLVELPAEIIDANPWLWPVKSPGQNRSDPGPPAGQ